MKGGVERKLVRSRASAAADQAPTGIENEGIQFQVELNHN